MLMASEAWLSPASRLFHPPRSSTAAFFSASGLPRLPRRSSCALATSTRGRRLRLGATDQQQQQGKQDGDEVVDSNVLQYCSIDGKGKKAEKRSLGEMEQEFLQALQAFYYDQKAIMSNEEFDNLKEELMWEGSSVVMLSPDEQRLLEASMAYAAGNPIMSDAEFDQLKLRLKKDGSDIVTEGPRCSLRSRKVYSDLTVDYLKMFLLNVPATTLALGLFFFIDELTGFEINIFQVNSFSFLPINYSTDYLTCFSPLGNLYEQMQLPEPFGFIFTWFAALPLILFIAQSITNAIVNDFLILKGPCPNCGAENLSFFGTILSVSSGGETNKVKCADCSTEMVYDSKSRLITLPEPSQ
ncbi:hypothetical protein DAI22_03g421700 [Oryza sativa Japonica Group]|nr:hypothetical protein DAI22_03g421700 [Oryza sativa Japonica Group]